MNNERLETLKKLIDLYGGILDVTHAETLLEFTKSALRNGNNEFIILYSQGGIIEEVVYFKHFVSWNSLSAEMKKEVTGIYEKHSDVFVNGNYHVVKR